ncbi:hypothetical protein MN0502_28530 [Arthrobacter sp. MN05-02]|nr:hypothetical protein MN0502_28530 [Arthrobacter sp. MN05-02]
MSRVSRTASSRGGYPVGLAAYPPVDVTAESDDAGRQCVDVGVHRDHGDPGVGLHDRAGAPDLAADRRFRLADELLLGQGGHEGSDGGAVEAAAPRELRTGQRTVSVHHRQDLGQVLRAKAFGAVDRSG